MKNNFKAPCPLSLSLSLSLSSMHDMPRSTQVLDAEGGREGGAGWRRARHFTMRASAAVDGTKSPVHKCGTFKRTGNGAAVPSPS